ncbi:MAG: hypothetical protein HOP19_05400 [Acidobacteria bacterium]|nr:hypothetical protein [Acidobacteriota bacterium]
MVFNQEHRTENPQTLNYTGDMSDPLVKRMVERLARAARDPQVRREMDAEQEVDRAINRLLDEKEREYQAALQEQELALQEKELVLQEKQAMLQAQEQLITELKKQLEERDNH